MKFDVCSLFNDASSVTQTSLYSVEWKGDKWTINCREFVLMCTDGEIDFNRRSAACKRAWQTFEQFDCLQFVLLASEILRVELPNLKNSYICAEKS
jgi:hypothetical protein